MKAEGVTITWVSPDEVPDQHDRIGFIDTCQYGRGMPVESNPADG